MAYRPAIGGRTRTRVVPDLDGAGFGGVAAQIAQLFEGLQMRVDGRSGGEADGLTDLPHRRRVAALAQLLLDHVEDALLTGGQIRCHGSSF